MSSILILLIILMLLTKEKQKMLVNRIECFIRKTNLNDTTICLTLRIFHYAIPTISFVIILSGSRHWVIIAEATHILIFIMFFAFDGCILTRIERRFSENCDDFTVIDPILNLIHVNRTNENRMIYSVYLSLIGFLATYLIYYYRFILTD